MKSITISKRLKSNTLMLYGLTFSNYFFALVTIPYLSRLLQPELYGLIGFAMASMVYFQLIVDFGFLLSSTQRIAENDTDIIVLRRIVTSVFFAKIILGIICFIILILLDYILNIFNKEKVLFVLFLLNTIISSLLPDYLYRGLEVMKVITIRTVAVKGLFTVLIFLFLNDNSNYLFIPLFYLTGSILSVLWSYFDIYKRFNVYFVPVSLKDIIIETRLSLPFFVSRIATTIYSASNAIILKLVYPTNIEIGYYISADKIISISRTASAPVADSIYPYMVKNKDFKIIFKILKCAIPVIFILCILLWVYAIPICVFIFGEQYYSTGEVLRYLIPLIAFVLPSYLLGFPTLVPLGLGNIANLSVIVGAVIHFIGLCLMYYKCMINLINVCILTSITEGIILFIRIFASLYGYKKITKTSI